MPVRKTACSGNISIPRPGGDQTPFVYSGTLIVQGQGIAVVRATGALTEFGRIGKSLQSLEQEETLLQKETRRLVRKIALAGLFICVLVVVIYGLSRVAG